MRVRKEEVTLQFPKYLETLYNLREIEEINVVLGQEKKRITLIIRKMRVWEMSRTKK